MIVTLVAVGFTLIAGTVTCICLGGVVACSNVLLVITSPSTSPIVIPWTWLFLIRLPVMVKSLYSISRPARPLSISSLRMKIVCVVLPPATSRMLSRMTTPPDGDFVPLVQNWIMSGWSPVARLILKE